MNTSYFLFALLIGLSAGVSSGLFGIGGGVIIVPLLLYFFKYSQQTATATSLVVLALPVGLLAIINYYKLGFLKIDQFKLAPLISLAMLIGGYFGSKLASQLQSQTLTRMFSIFLIVIAIRLWFTAK